MWWMFCHDRIAFLRKDEILISFTNSCNYRVLIVVEWVCQSKVPSSIIINSVSVKYSQAWYWFTHQSYQNGFVVAWSSEPGHWMPPNKQELYRDMINN
jgi:hypothetical protein